MISKGLANVILVVVTLVWAGNFLASAFLPGYQSESVYNFVFMGTAGIALAIRQDGNGSLLLRMIAAWRGVPLPPDSTKPEEDRRT